MARRSFARRLRDAFTVFTRRYDGARLTPDRNMRFTTYAGEVPAAAALLRNRSRALAENNPYFSAAIRTLAKDLVGAEIVPGSTHPDPATQKLLAEAWAVFSAVADFDGITTLGGLEAALVTDMARDGDGLAIMRNTEDGLRIQRVSAEMLDDSQTRDLGGGAFIQNGIQFDSAGRRVAYWFFPAAPANTFAANVQSVPVPAEDVIHLFEPRGPGQCRGVPSGSAAIKRMGEIDQLEDALLVGNKVAAMLCGVVTDDYASGPLPFDGEQNGSTLTSGLEPGTILNLGAGKKITFSTPAQSAQGVEFLASQLRAVASAFGVPPHCIDSDYSKANFSSLRASLVTYAGRLDQIVHTILRPQLLDRIWRRWITTEILRGAIEAPDFESNPDPWFSVEWFPPAPPVADEAKAAQADALQIASGLKSRSQAIRERGYAPEALDAERAADAERAKALGLDQDQAETKEEESENV
jgi:lambda family phage portal protein